MAPTTRSGERGFAYLAALFMLAVLSVMSARAFLIWKAAEQQARESELLWVGEQYRVAIEKYYQDFPGSDKHYPSELKDLLTHQFTLLEHPLRRLYRDPITNSKEWGLVQTSDGKIKGVYSLSTAQPQKVGGFPKNEASFANAKHYQDWQFVYEPPS